MSRDEFRIAEKLTCNADEHPLALVVRSVLENPGRFTETRTAAVVEIGVNQN